MSTHQPDSPIAGRVHACLDESGVEYEVLRHHVDHTAFQTAWDTHTPPHAFAKTVFAMVDDAPAMVVMPADERLSEIKLALALSAHEVRLATEAEIEQLCPDCELGAAPPFGPLYDLPVYVSPEVGANECITFNGGTHRAALRMRYADFADLSQAQIVPVGRHD